MTVVWPAPETKQRPWHARRLPLAGSTSATTVEVRQVRLWGKWVLIDREHDVYCPTCLAFVTVAELGHPFNHHPVGLPRRGVMTRQTEDDR